MDSEFSEVQVERGYSSPLAQTADDQFLNATPASIIR